MATVEVVVLSCDLCSREGGEVTTHEVGVDRKRVEVEACERCWTKAEKALTPVLTAGRRVRKVRAKRA